LKRGCSFGLGLYFLQVKSALWYQSYNCAAYRNNYLYSELYSTVIWTFMEAWLVWSCFFMHTGTQGRLPA